MDTLGEADISALVDFSALKKYIARHGIHLDHHNKGLPMIFTVSTYGPTTQGEFLQELGIDIRLAKLLRTATSSQATQLTSAYLLTIKSDMAITYLIYL